MSTLKKTLIGVATIGALALTYSEGADTLDRLATEPPTATTTPAPDTNHAPHNTPTPENDPAAAALDKLTDIPIAEPANPDSYDRDTWGYGDPIQGNCNARALTLQHASTTPTETNTNCTVTSGEWTGYDTGHTYTDPSDVHIDHLVPLAEVHESGGHAWNTDRKETYANDPGGRQLVVADATANEEKGDADPGEWMPPTNQCRYLVDWITIKHDWNLTVDQDENDALMAHLDAYC